VIVNALEGQPLPIYGDGQQVRDWLFVTDHCKAIADVIERGAPGESYNVGGDAERANVDIVRSVCDILDELSPEGAPHRRLIEYVADRPGHDRRYAIDSSRLNHRLGWQPETDLQAGLRQTCEWFLDQWRDDGWPAEGRKSL
jgi:dTDP-glucose 4,6-dehydratase